MDKSEYLQKMENVLNDNRKSKCLEDKSDEIDKVQRKVINKIKMLTDSSLIDDAIAQKVKTVGSSTSAMYGLSEYQFHVRARERLLSAFLRCTTKEKY